MLERERLKIADILTSEVWKSEELKEEFVEKINEINTELDMFETKAYRRLPRPARRQARDSAKNSSQREKACQDIVRT